MLMPLENATHLEIGSTTHVAFVFSCPGRHESEADPPGPAKGKTGDNLQELVDILGSNQRTYLQRGNARITNAWSQVEYGTPGGTGRSEPYDSEVLDPDNLNRLKTELADIEQAVICCGKKAALAVCRLADQGCLRDGVRVALVPHLGNRGLNTVMNNRDCNLIQPGPSGESRSQGQNRRRRIRLALVAERIRAQVPQLRE